ncbi:MAG: hypothetical protein KA273_00605, partial [Bacteroidales bacterium]|nr:hypothetical protein [Bacteroidales bacterium]
MKKIVYLLMAVAMVMTACSKKDEKKTTSQDETVKVKIEKVSMEEIDQIYDFTTTVDAAVKNYITSAGGTRIE